MPRREIGLMGYIGERVVERWLRQRYGPPRFDIVAQVRPVGLTSRGGPYLDFGVIEGSKVRAIFEVKCQDYIFNGGVNIGIRYIWRRRRRALEFVLPDGTRHQGDARTEAYLVLLVPPNADGMREIGRNNVKNVILLSQIMREVGRVTVEHLLSDIRVDIDWVINLLREPKQGRTYLESFLRARGRPKLRLKGRRQRMGK